MSRIDELIRELCPEGVPRLPLTSVANFDRGLTYQKADEDPSGDVIVLRASNINQQSNTINVSDVKRLRTGFQANPRTKLHEGDILLTAASGSRAHIGKVAYVSEEINAHFGGFMMAIRANSSVEGKYLFHFLTSNAFRDYLDSALSTSTINNINSRVLSGFDIPVPPLEVQREIVSILDKFTQLEAELEAELEARRTQYEVTRDRLLDFSGDLSAHPMGEMIRELCPEGVQHLSLGTLEDTGYLKLGRGDVISKTDLTNFPGDFPVYSSSSIGNGEFGRYGRYMFDDERITWSVDGGGRFFFRQAHLYSVTNVCGWLKVLRPEDLSTRYLYFVLSSLWTRREYNYTVKAHPSVIRQDYTVPFPPLEIQKEIVSTLDKLDALVNDITYGLPAEIEARRKQYEYYRDKLLTFKELDAA